MEILSRFISAVIGALGFAFLFHVRPGRLIFSCFAGLLAYGVYALAVFYGGSLFLCNIAAAAVATLCADIMAVIFKCPATVFLTVSVTPLVPGSSLYYTLSNFVFWNSVSFTKNILDTIHIGLGIAVGIIITSAIFDAFMRMFNNFQKFKILE
ncbi:MAG: threonine/serine exporter family protein [Bacillota bacterium]|nr:threonine/serine exporter family protein [Bacillota bacterium]